MQQININSEPTQKTKSKSLTIILNNINSKVITEDAIRKQLFRVMKFHIGEENAISANDLFYNVFKVHWNELDPYKANYLFDILKLIIRKMRWSGQIFFINKKSRYFVLKTQLEAENYKKILDRDIQTMKLAKIKANEWVEKQSWRQLLQ